MSGTVVSGAWWIWPVAALLYVLFRAWYDNWRKPLSAQEVEHYLRLIQTSPVPSTLIRKCCGNFWRVTMARNLSCATWSGCTRSRFRIR